MNKYALIVIVLICSLSSNGQTDIPISGSNGFTCKNGFVKRLSNKFLIADETYLTYTKTGARIVTYSYSIFKDLSRNFGHAFERLLTHKMKDGGKLYKKYTILVSTDVGDSITEWAKTNL